MPTLHEVRKMVIETMPDAWNVISSAGPNPTFRYEVTASVWADVLAVESVSHHSVASYRPDVSLTIAWGLGSDRSLTFPWASWPDPSVTPTSLDLYWNGALVERLSGLVVDGGRANLPFPNLDTAANPSVEYFEGDEVEMWRVVDELSGGSEFDRYLSDTGLLVRR